MCSASGWGMSPTAPTSARFPNAAGRGWRGWMCWCWTRCASSRTRPISQSTRRWRWWSGCGRGGRCSRTCRTTSSTPRSAASCRRGWSWPTTGCGLNSSRSRLSEGTMEEQLRQHLERAGQDHVLAWWPQLSEPERQALTRQLEVLDFEQLRELYAQRDEPNVVPSADRIAPAPAARLDPHDTETRKAGEDALRRGEVAVLIVAGGQGTRLGFDHPKGMFPIGPVTDKSLFHIHAEKVMALQRRYRQPIPLLVMTSPPTHDETVAFFQQHQRF